MISLLLPIFLYSVVFKMFWKQYIQSIAYDHFVFHVSLKVPFRQEMLWLMQICIEKLHPFDLTRNKRKYLKASWNKLAYDFVFPFHFVFFFYTRSVISGMKIKELVINDLQLSIFNKRCKYALSLTLSWHRYLSRLRPEKLTVNVFSKRALPLFFLYKRSLSPWDVSTIL